MSVILKRRAFLGGLLAVAAEPVIDVHRTYSFIWTPPEPRIIQPEEFPWPHPDMARHLVMTPWMALTGLTYILARAQAEG
jgi:hypothetical protein